MKKQELKTIRIFEPIKKFDCEIRTIKEEQHEDKTFYYVVEVGYFESIGEKGLINTFFYDNYPTINEILKDIEEDLRASLEEYKSNNCLTYNKEQYLKILKEIFKK